ncbi:MAG: hypothetical protein RR855_15985 [Comamonas sp.]
MRLPASNTASLTAQRMRAALQAWCARQPDASNVTPVHDAVLWRQRWVLLGGMAVLLVLALVWPPVLQPAHYHAFADQRSWGALPHAGDVLSNLGFLLAAVAGAGLLWRADARWLSPAVRGLVALFLVGLAASAGGSACYHWAPVDGSLAWDRLGMGLAFAGLLGLAVHTRLDDESACWMAAAVLVAAPLAVRVWWQTGNVLPWSLLQAGGALAVLWLAWLRPRPGALPVALGWVVLWYALAKLLELSDAFVFAATGELVSGHSLKHWVAACAAWPVLRALHVLRIKQ